MKPGRVDAAYPIPDAALNAHLAILGRTGGGKSYTARGSVETLVKNGRRVCVLDPVGVWWGIRSDAAGTGPGLPVAVFGGEHADVAINERAGKQLGGLIAGNNLPCVVDTSEMGRGERVRFSTELLHELYRKNRQALWLVMEEADTLAPQSPLPETRRLLDAAHTLAARGRARGFRLMLITQRPAKLHKDVLTQVGCLVVHRLTAPQDRKAIEDWISSNADVGEARKVTATLPALETGEAWVWAPAHDVLARAKMPPIATFDSSRTPGPDEEAVEPTTLADVDLSGLAEALADPEAEEDKSRIKYARNYARADAAALAEAEARGYDRASTELHQVINWQSRQRLRALDTLRAAQADLGRAIHMLAETRESGETVPAPAAAAPAATETPPAAGVGPPAAFGPVELPPAARRMLEVLDTNPPVRMSWGALSASVGNKARGGHFNACRKALRESGLIVEDGSLVRIKSPSAAASAPAEPAERAAFLRGKWQSILGGRPAQIIGLLADQPMTKLDVAAALGCSPQGGHWNAAWKALRDNEIIVEAGGVFALVDELHG